MKSNKIIFWVSTVLFSLFMLFSAYNYISSEEMKGAFVHLGFPDYFRIELAIAKTLGAIVLLLPFLPSTVRGFAYAGFIINIISAAVAHLAIGEPISSLGFVLFAGVLLGLSYWSSLKLENK
ncbi:MAG: DoxX family protein [Myroides sp.]|nr:DoxX family protein [Myroides sp.]